MKTLTSAVSTQVAAIQSQPVILVEITLNAGILRFCTGKNNIIFPTGGNTYTARAIVIKDVSQSVEGQIDRITIKIDNVTGEFTSYAATESFDTKKIVIKKVYLDTLDNVANYIEIFNGTLEEVQRLNYLYCKLEAVSGKPLNRQLLSDIYQTTCNRMFGDEGCNLDGLADLTSLSLTTNVISGSASTVETKSSMVDDYWNFGQIKIEVSGVTYYRRINDFSNSGGEFELDVALPIKITSGSTIQVYKGCDQTWTTCQGSNAWGPSADNKANFFGFIHITKQSGSIGTAGPFETVYSGGNINVGFEGYAGDIGGVGGDIGGFGVGGGVGGGIGSGSVGTGVA